MSDLERLVSSESDTSGESQESSDDIQRIISEYKNGENRAFDDHAVSSAIKLEFHSGREKLSNETTKVDATSGEKNIVKSVCDHLANGDAGGYRTIKRKANSTEAQREASEVVEALGDVFQWIAQTLNGMQKIMKEVKEKMEETDETVHNVAQRLRAQKHIITMLDNRMLNLEMKGRVDGDRVPEEVTDASTSRLTSPPPSSPPPPPSSPPPPSPPPPSSPPPPQPAAHPRADTPLPKGEALSERGGGRGGGGHLGHAERLGMMLLKAAQQGKTEVARNLLDAGADPNFSYGLKWTSLHMAAKAHPCVLALLIKRGAKLNASTTNGFTAMHIAAYFDFDGRCVQQLIDGGADLDGRNQCGWTPLHYAAACGNTVAVRALLAAGAEWAPKDIEGRTPLDVAAIAVQPILQGGSPPQLRRPRPIVAKDGPRWRF